MTTATVLYSISWFGAAISVVGAYMVAENNRRGFIPFIIADLLLIGIQVYAHIWSQAILLVIYLIMSSRGLLNSIERHPTGWRWKE